MTKLLRKAREYAHSHHVVQVCVVRSGTFGHLAYFGAVSMEGHGLYATMAAVMMVITVVTVTLGFDGE